MLAISQTAASLSLAGQLTSMVLAAVIGRFAVKSRAAILLTAMLGGVGAMIAHIVVDGQAAFLLLMYVPVIYLVSTIGRKDI